MNKLLISLAVMMLALLSTQSLADISLDSDSCEQKIYQQNGSNDALKTCLEEKSRAKSHAFVRKFSDITLNIVIPSAPAPISRTISAPLPAAVQQRITPVPPFQSTPPSRPRIDYN